MLLELLLLLVQIEQLKKEVEKLRERCDFLRSAATSYCGQGFSTLAISLAAA